MTIRRSKTNQEGKGEVIPIIRGSMPLSTKRISDECSTPRGIDFQDAGLFTSQIDGHPPELCAGR